MSQKLSNIKKIVLHEPPNGFQHVYQMYPIRVRNGLRDRLMQHLTERGIMTKIKFFPVHLSHFYKKELKYDCQLAVTEHISQQVLTLPMYPALTEEEIEYIAKEIARFFRKG